MKINHNEFIKKSRFILASASPRRAELLKSLGIEFEIRPAMIDESQRAGETPRCLVMRLALEKARSVAEPHCLVLGADTIVVLGDEIFGKPVSPNEATQFLKTLSGKTHEVITGFALLRGCNKIIVNEAETSLVSFRQLSDAQIQAYVNSGDPMDKAGAYGIQNLGPDFIERIDGSLNNIIGLPIETLKGTTGPFEKRNPRI